MGEAESYLFGLFEKVRCLRETHILEECVQGEPLSRRIETEHYLTEREARRCLLALADGLAVLHAHRILHRDIKPENLIEERDGTIRLIDFDAARVMGAEGEEKAADIFNGWTDAYDVPIDNAAGLLNIPLAGLAIADPAGNTSGRTMHLELRGIDHEIFGSYIDIDFVPEAAFEHHLGADGEWH